MCGIAGSFQLDNGAPLSDERMLAALERLAHRGPDDQGIHRDGRIVLGHRRLSITDTSDAGHQPFTDDGGRYTIVFNGEAFNFRALRASLEAQGHVFRSGTDTEVVLRLFLLKGEACLHDINGFFALAIHDARTGRLFVARDRFGIKPLFWCVHEGRFLFASEMGALMELGAPRGLDTIAERLYFRFLYTPAPRTMLAGVQKLLPGHAITSIPHASAPIAPVPWYVLKPDPQRVSTRSDAATRLRDLLDDAVRLRLSADVPVGTFLSGGLDSSIISALAIHHKRDLHTFSIGFADDPYYDESNHAEEVAAHIGSQHTTFKLTHDDLVEAYPRLLEAFDEPFADSSALPAFVLCEQARKQVTVALSGDGADELFGGYRKHQAEIRYRCPTLLDRMVVAGGPLWKILPHSRNGILPDTLRKLDRFARHKHVEPEQRYLGLAMAEEGTTADRLAAAGTDDGMLAEDLNRITRPFAADSSLNAMLLADVATVLPDDMLNKMDLASMAHGLEVRVPFLDHRLVEFAFGLRAEMKFQRGHGKELLRETFGELLPPSVIHRRKQGFEVPLRDLFLDPLSPLVDRLLNKERLSRLGLDPEAVLAVRRRLASSSPGNSPATMHALLFLSSWAHRWGIARDMG